LTRRFEFDQAKSAKNERERGLPFDLAPAMFDGPMLAWADERFDYGEARINGLGRIGSRDFFVTYVVRGNITRIISFRKANKGEREAYDAYLDPSRESEG
jgi:uncharacterized DUF497 family protein